MVDMDTVGERIRAARESAGITQVELARLVGVSKVAISAIESGKTKSPTPSTLFKIADALGSDAARLAMGEHGGVVIRGEQSEDGARAFAVEVRDRLSATKDHAEVPVWDARAAAGGGVVNGDAVGPKGSILFRSRSLSKQGISTKNSHVWYVHGDSMVPRLRDGDAVLFDASDKTVRAGKVYVLRKGEETFVKRLYREGSRYRVVSDNKADPQWQDWFVEADDLDFEIIGRVRWVGSWED
jgi:phage repressor protein C with HTH and peptisase S24 domain